MFTGEDLRRIAEEHPGHPLQIMLGNGQRHVLQTVEHYSAYERYVRLRDAQGRDVFVALSWICVVIPLPARRTSPQEP